MQRKPSKNRNGRGPNAQEKEYQGWLKYQPCVWCVNPAPSIVDHCRGSTFGHNKVHIGHAFCISQCQICDTQKTIYGKRQGNEAQAWLKQVNQFHLEKGIELFFPIEVYQSIENFNK